MNGEILTGYHGTKKENIDSICLNNFEINKDVNSKLFLGYGVYFFEKYSDAADWNVKSFIKEYKYFPKYEIMVQKYSIIESEIRISNEDVLDLDEKENLFKLEIALEKIKGKLITKPEYQRAKNKTSAMINMMYKRKLIKRKIIMKTFWEQINVKNLNSLKNYPRKMFCVKDISIIVKNKESKILDENDFESIVFFYR